MPPNFAHRRLYDVGGVCIRKNEEKRRKSGFLGRFFRDFSGKKDFYTQNGINALHLDYAPSQLIGLHNLNPLVIHRQHLTADIGTPRQILLIVVFDATAAPLQFV